VTRPGVRRWDHIDLRRRTRQRAILELINFCKQLRSRVAHSQTVSTRHPDWQRAAATRRSRNTLASNLAFQNREPPVGVVVNLQPRWRCQKQPCSWVPIELTRVFRQTEREFIDLLSNIRRGVQVRESIRVLNTSCAGKPRPAGVLEIALVSSRKQAEEINRVELERLPLPEVEFAGVMEGRMQQDKKLPSPNDLRLRPGAQIMFTRNDKMRRWVNGTMGKVVEVMKDRVMVLIPGHDKAVEVTAERWEQYEYRWNPQLRELVTEVVGCFVQIPLAHAWAATIHKAQGQTFEYALVDLGHGAFASGQTYVAISRCRARAGLRLARPIREDDVKVDPQILALHDEMRKGTEGVDVEAMATALREARLGGTASSDP
jgi:hypothetical protein